MPRTHHTAQFQSRVLLIRMVNDVLHTRIRCPLNVFALCTSFHIYILNVIRLHEDRQSRPSHKRVMGLTCQYGVKQTSQFQSLTIFHYVSGNLWVGRREKRVWATDCHTVTLRSSGTQRLRVRCLNDVSAPVTIDGTGAGESPIACLSPIIARVPRYVRDYVPQKGLMPLRNPSNPSGNAPW